MRDTASGLNSRIAKRVRDLRADLGLSLEALAGCSGVSRSMISLIERGASSPTAVVLEKLGRGLGVTLPALFDAPESVNPIPTGPLARSKDQLQWTDPVSGYQRRNVSPPAALQPMQIVEVHFPANGRIAFDNGGKNARIQQQIWILQGAMDVTVGNTCYHLGKGDCLAMRLDQPTMFHNPTRMVARYAVVIESGAQARRR
jgi:transcriptional regulator with XRE-family HTH domain